MSGKFLSTLKKAASTAADILTTKGDILSRSASALGRLAVGTNGQVLTAKSSETLGVSWETPTDVAPPTTTKGDLSGYSTAQARIPVGSNLTILTADSTAALGVAWTAPAIQTESFIIACSDESTALTTGTAVISFRMPYAFTLTAGAGGITASCNQAPTGAILTMDVNEAGSTILSTKLTIAISSTTSVGGTAPVISDVNLAANALMTIDIDQIGSTNAGTGLKITLIGVKA
jgi:hypothetical protein|tara:strand:+ start:13 stop:711 length:699 start_codon:yes stop_codon:yes gene_type:complete